MPLTIREFRVRHIVSARPPEKTVMSTVTHLARRFHVSADTIRHYTKLGLLTPNRDPDNGYRYYTLDDESRLRFILSAKKLGFGLRDIQKIFSVADAGDAPCPLVRELIEERVEQVRQEINDAQLLMTEMENAIGHWRSLPDKTPSRNRICHLIDAWQERTAQSDSLY